MILVSGCLDIGHPSLAQRFSDVRRVILQDEINLLSRGRRRYEHMKLDDTSHKVGLRILALQHLAAAAQDVPGTGQAVQPDIAGIQDGVDKPPGHRLIQLAPEGPDQRIADEVDHPGHGDEVILHVLVGRIAGGVVAPHLEAAHEVEAGHNAAGVEDVG